MRHNYRGEQYPTKITIESVVDKKKVFILTPILQIDFRMHEFDVLGNTKWRKMMTRPNIFPLAYSEENKTIAFVVYHTTQRYNPNDLGAINPESSRWQNFFETYPWTRLNYVPKSIIF